MSRPSLVQVLRRLADEGLVDREALASLAGEAAAAAPGTPWFVRVLLGLGAWVAALLLVIFLFTVDLVQTGPGGALTGLGLCALAVLGRRLGRGQDFLEQLCLALVLAGQALTWWSLQEWTDTSQVASFLALALAAAMTLFYPDRLGRFLSLNLAALALLVCLQDLELPLAGDILALAMALLAGWAWLGRERLLAGGWGELQPPLGYGSAFVLLWSLLLGLGDVSGASLVATAGLTLATAWLVAHLQRPLRPPLSPLLLPGAVLAVGLLTARVPGVMAALAVLTLGFWAGSRLLQGLAWVFLAVYLTAFYYYLPMTLLEKSAALLACGLALLGLRLLLGRQRQPLAGRRGPRLAGYRPGLVVLGLLLALGLPSAGILHKERLLASGSPLYLELAPADPRSLIQGDYMALDYEVSRQARALVGEQRRGLLVLRRDRRGVGRFVEVARPGRRPGPGEVLLAFRRRGQGLVLGAEAFYFQEGQAPLLAGARYGELRVADSGESVLVGLRGADLEPLGEPPRP